MIRSFRDPSGHVEDDGHTVRRLINREYGQATLEFVGSPLFKSLVDEGLLIGVSSCRQAADGTLWIEHPRVTIPSYPFEWTPGMLADAALLTLRVQSLAWAQGWSLKDAAAQNVLFQGGRPVFCDLLSFEKRHQHEPNTWIAYGQFVRHFILPLLAIVELGRSPRDIFLANRDGLRANDVSPLVPWNAQFHLAMWLHVRLPARLERRRNLGGRTTSAARPKKQVADGIPWLIDNLQSFVLRLADGKKSVSTWSGYQNNRHHYELDALAAKRQTLKFLLDRGQFQAVLDIGANTGEYSTLAAQQGAMVVAIDDDILALDKLYRDCKATDLNLQCMHVNFAHPSPAVGWRFKEAMSLPVRFAKRFELVMMLAVVHHLLISERLPLPEIFETVAEICTNTLLIEFIANDDPRFVEIAGPNLPLYKSWSKEYFLEAASPWFLVTNEVAISPHRTLFELRRKSGP